LEEDEKERETNKMYEREKRQQDGEMEQGIETFKILTAA